MDNDIITNLQIKQIQATLNSQEYKTAIQKNGSSTVCARTEQKIEEN